MNRNEIIQARSAHYGEKPVEHRQSAIALRDAPSSLLDPTEGFSGVPVVGFTGYASTVDEPYAVRDHLGEYTETISRGAFTKALNEAQDVRLLINHKGLPLARTKSGTMSLREDDHGLFVDVPSLDGDSPLVQSVRSAMQRGDVDEMSFAFKATRQEWNDDYTERMIREVKLYDVSLVTYPANPGTSAKLRSDDLHDLDDVIEELAPTVRADFDATARRMAQLRAAGYIL